MVLRNGGISIDPPVTHNHFKTQLNSSLVSAVESQVRKARYLDLLLSGDEKTKLEGAVRDACAKEVESRGFQLLGCRVDVETAEPTPDALAHNPTLSEEWNAYVERKQNLELAEQKRKNEHAAELLRLQNSHQLEQKRLASQSTVDLQREENKCQDDKRILQNEDLENQRKAKEKSEPVQKAIAMVDDTIQRQKIQFEHDRKKTEIDLQTQRDAFAAEKKCEAEKEQKTHEQAMMAMTREEEIRQAGHALEKEKQDGDLLTLQVKKVAMQKEKDSVEAASIMELGRAKSEVERLHTLAAKADTIQLSEGLLKALPNVMEKAYQPCQKIGDVRMLVVSGDRQALQTAGDHATENGLMGTVLASMSLIPLVREVIAFLKEGAGAMSAQQSGTQKKATAQTEATGDSKAQP